MRITDQNTTTDASSRLQVVTRAMKREHTYLDADDDCFYFWTYAPGLGRTGGPTNVVILDLKNDADAPDQRNAKAAAIRRCADLLSRGLRSAHLRSATFVPIPGSKAGPSADTRLIQILRAVRPPLCDIRELLLPRKSTAAGIKGLSVDERMRLWKFRSDMTGAKPSTIVLFDDVLTSGCHFKAAKKILRKRFSRADVLGVFIARRSARPCNEAAGADSHTKHRKTSVSVVGRSLDEISSQALDAIARKNSPPIILSRGGKLVRLRSAPPEVPGQHCRLVAEDFCADSLRGVLARELSFLGSRGVINPPNAVVRDILSLGHWSFPELSGIVATPVLRPSGSILSTPGYDPETGLIFRPNCQEPIRVPDHPTAREIREARDLLVNDLLGDFSFGEGALANILAMVLTPLVRPAVGCVPLALVDAPFPGSGKGLLCSAMARILTGRDTAKGIMPKEDGELRKAITAILLSGESIVVFDNVDTRVQSSRLAALLTAEIWRDRRLGESQELYLRNNVTWIATGNRMSVGGDMDRRCYRIRLTPTTSQPWLRNSFRHPDLSAWTSHNRARLLNALLTLLSGYVSQADLPSEASTLGSFEGWSQIMSGVMQVAGVRGFLTDVLSRHPNASKPQASAACA